MAGELPGARRPVDLMNAAALKESLEGARRRLAAAETEMERALQQVEAAARESKSIISAALSAALAETKAARQQLLALEAAVADP